MLDLTWKAIAHTGMMVWRYLIIGVFNYSRYNSHPQFILHKEVTGQVQESSYKISDDTPINPKRNDTKTVPKGEV
jgi:hypothetical protein